MTINFVECGRRFSANTTEGELLRQTWGWNHTVIGIKPNNLTQISREGCIHVCGSGTELYPWKDVSGVITTWILPVIGILAQAPFESNAAWRTLLAITRWVGSPIASLSYVLWNIKVSAKAAMMVDMAVKYDEYDETHDDKSDFASMRDSMYLLLVMNQYTLKPTARSEDLQKEAEHLLRITLFSKDLKLIDTKETLRETRHKLAREVRQMRRRGTVPVFVSILWFLFAFALSIQDAFVNLGANSTAHDLALGCLLAWFPVLIMGSIVDRNPIAAEAIREKLSALVDQVRHALQDERHRNEFIETFNDQPDLRHLIQAVARKSEFMGEFFMEFAGQARIRWHYGAAHAILSDIEHCYIEDKGRNWLENEYEARANLVLGPANEEGLVWFDVREFWQVLSAIIIVAGSCGGAFILSYFTPTVGLGCRSGGYTIFFSVALGLLVVEMTVWMFLSPYEFDAHILANARGRLHSHVSVIKWENASWKRWTNAKQIASKTLDATGRFLARCVVSIALIAPWKDKKATEKRVWSVLETTKKRVEDASKEMGENLRKMPIKRRWELFFFRPIETFNTAWLIYIVLAQVFGWYRTCDCATSNWSWGGGYLDFSQQDQSNSIWIAWIWVSGTVLTATVMSLSMFYITVEWCQQSFLSTEDYKQAMSGLRMTRTYRSWTFFARRMSRTALNQLEQFAVAIHLIKKQHKKQHNKQHKKPQRTLMWTRDQKKNPDIARSVSPSGTYHVHGDPPPIAMTNYDDAALNAILETQVLVHHLFPPVATPRGLRKDSDASVDPHGVSSRPCGSDELSNEAEGRTGGGERSSWETLSLGARADV